MIGRFSTFLEHVKPSATGTRVTRYNALFHWRVPPGREIEAGREVGRHHILTHAYWREGGPEFANVNIMAVAHGTDKALVLAHKAAIDAHLGVGREFRCPTPMCSGAGAAKSNRQRFRRARTRRGWRALSPNHRTFLYILPPFITNITRRSAVMSVLGSPATAMMSACIPGAIAPI